MTTAKVYFSNWAKIRLVNVTPQVRAVLATLYSSNDGIWYCCQTSTKHELEPHLIETPDR